MNNKLNAALALALAALAGAASATEGGGTIYPVGAENYTCCALPPPGLYGMAWYQHYSADAVRGNGGEVVTPSTFKVTANAIVPRVVYVTPMVVAGASLGVQAILPIVNLDVNVASGVQQSKTGFGDMTFGPVLGWHLSEKLHSVLALDIYAPTGAYKKGDVANIGRNHWALQPVLGFSYIQPHGFNADLKTMWTYNFKNDDTDYKDGKELIVDYSAGWGVGGGWTLGVGGYYYQQLTNDSQSGATIDNNKGRAVAFGPSVRYDSGKGWFITAKYQDEMAVRNRADGAAFWVKAVFPL
ncbi:transporter [Zoogloea sp. LCSB751]|uniref:SphA family protein n=1 Tax=Zoogloea sp. LCSB751 TaxID=1965277 RepID=UPI0009A5156A|nr:transporter [Zoogloea sp. LCSB751]